MDWGDRDAEPNGSFVPIVPPHFPDDGRDVLDPDFDDFSLADWSGLAVSVDSVND